MGLVERNDRISDIIWPRSQTDENTRRFLRVNFFIGCLLGLISSALLAGLVWLLLNEKNDSVYSENIAVVSWNLRTICQQWEDQPAELLLAANLAGDPEKGLKIQPATTLRIKAGIQGEDFQGFLLTFALPTLEKQWMSRVVLQIYQTQAAKDAPLCQIIQADASGNEVWPGESYARQIYRPSFLSDVPESNQVIAGWHYYDLTVFFQEAQAMEKNKVTLVFFHHNLQDDLLFPILAQEPILHYQFSNEEQNTALLFETNDSDHVIGTVHLLEHDHPDGWSIVPNPFKVRCNSVYKFHLRDGENGPLLEKLGGQLVIYYQPTVNGQPLTRVGYASPFGAWFELIVTADGRLITTSD